MFADVPHSTHDRALLSGDGLSLVEVLPQTSLVSSKREARQLLGNGAISINGARAEPDTRLTTDHLLHGRLILLRKGKKHDHATEWGG